MAAFAVLAADLEWTSTRVVGTIGVLLGWLWAALLVQLVLTFPEGRPWTRAARVVIAAAYAAAAGGQIVLAFTSASTHAVHRAQEITALAVAAPYGPRRAAIAHPARPWAPGAGSAPLGAAVSATTSVAVLGWLLAADATSTA